MAESVHQLNRQIHSASDLHTVVGAMKALAASNMGRYVECVEALGEYNHAVELGLSVCFRRKLNLGIPDPTISNGRRMQRQVIVFGSDQGLVGQFNEKVAELVLEKVKAWNDSRTQIWTVGSRVQERLEQAGLNTERLFSTPNSVKAITPLMGEILIATQMASPDPDRQELHLFYNHPTNGPLYETTHFKLLPLDHEWIRRIQSIPWPTRNLPEVVGSGDQSMKSFIKEYLFISLFRACAESLASENASRLSGMQRAEKNIDEILTHLKSRYNQIRQSQIDEELFDVISGFEALKI